MGLLKPAVNQTAHLKLGILGFEGSGKTHTASLIAIGMAEKTGKKKVAWFDTEKSSDFHVKRFKEAGIQLDVVKSRSFSDLLTTVREAQAGGYSFLIIDSISHVWRDITTSYQKKRNRSKLTMNDWGILKTEWAQFTDLFVNAPISIAMLGRAGHEYDMDEDDDGNMEIRKSGTKMKVETETGFEPDLLLEMFKVKKTSVTKTAKGRTKTKQEKGIVNKCVVIKDRTDTMNGKEIDMPTFKDFASVVNFLNIGGEHKGVDTSRDSQDLFDSPDHSWAHREKLKTIYLEQLQEALILAKLDGTSKEAKEGRTTTLIKYFGTSAKTAIEGMEPTEIKARLDKLKLDLHLMPADPIQDPPALDTAENF